MAAACARVFARDRALSLPAERFNFCDDVLGITVKMQIISRCVTKKGRTIVVSQDGATGSPFGIAQLRSCRQAVLRLAIFPEQPTLAVDSLIKALTRETRSCSDGYGVLSVLPIRHRSPLPPSTVDPRITSPSIVATPAPRRGAKSDRAAIHLR